MLKYQFTKIKSISVRNYHLIIIVIVWYAASGKPDPKLIELYTKQAKRIFKYWEKSFPIMLDMIEFCDGEPVLSKIDQNTTSIPSTNKLNKIRYK